MSLFDSLYDEGADPAAPPPGPAPELDVPAGPLASPTMSLQEFATEVFGTRTQAAEPVDGTGTPGGPDGLATALAVADTDSPATAPSDFASILDAPPGEDVAREAADAPAPPASPFADPAPLVGPPAAGADKFASYPLLEDDLLPARKPRRRPSAPSLGGARDVRPRTLALLVAVALVGGFFGFRTFLGGGASGGTADGEAAAATGALPGALPGAQPSGGTQGVLPGVGSGPVGAIEAALLLSAEADLRNATMPAAAHFAETGSYALSTEEWSDLIGRPVAAVSDAPAADALEVVSDADAVCFQTATQGGTLVAAGLSEAGMTFASGPEGTALCTADVSVLAGWSPSLVS